MSRFPRPRLQPPVAARGAWRRIVLRWSVGLLVTAMVLGRLADWRAEALWFEFVSRASGDDYSAIYARIMQWRAALFVVGAGSFALALWLNARTALRIAQNTPAPLDLLDLSRHDGPREDASKARRRLIPLEDKLQFDALRPWAGSVFIGGGALLAGTYAAQQWMHVARFFGCFALGSPDPYLGRDLSFYLFQLPALNFVWSFVALTGWACLLLSAAIYVYEDVWQLGARQMQLSPPALRHLALLVAFLLIWKVPDYALALPNSLVTQRSAFFGVTWVDVHWRWSALLICSVLALLAAATCVLFARSGQIRRATLAPVLFFLATFGFNTLLPILAQVLFSTPQRESFYLARHWSWTRHAYGLDRPPHDAKVLWSQSARSRNQMNAAPLDIENTLDASSLPSWPAAALVGQWQGKAASNARWSLPQLDRYALDSQDSAPDVTTPTTRAVYVATRISWPRANSNWLELHSPAPSGWRIADAARLGVDQLPLVLWDSDQVPPTKSGASSSAPLPIVFGAFEDGSEGTELLGSPSLNAPPASFFNAPPRAGSAMRGTNRLAIAANPMAATIGVAGAVEAPFALLDARQNAAEGWENAGVPLDSWAQRALLAWHLREGNLLLSTALSSEHRVAWHRAVVERCAQIAPWLLWSGTQPLPIVRRDGHLIWLLDGFSLSTTYPLSRPLDGTNINGLNAPIVATVDAFDGATHFYRLAADDRDDDPQIELWARFFPTLLHPLSDLPREVRRHLRYPPRLAASRGEIWARYGTQEPPDLLEPQKTRALFRDEDDGLPAFLSTPAALPVSSIATDQSLLATCLLIQETAPEADKRKSAAPPDSAPRRELAAVLMAHRDADGHDAIFQWQPTKPLDLAALRLKATADPLTAWRRSPHSNLSVLPHRDALLVRDVRVEKPANFDAPSENFVRTERQSVIRSHPTSPTPAAKATVKAKTARPSAPFVAPDKNAATLTRARFWWRVMHARRTRGDWRGFEKAQHELDKVLSTHP